MSASGQKRTFVLQQTMSALLPEAAPFLVTPSECSITVIAFALPNVRFWGRHAVSAHSVAAVERLL
jgi:hypothetical protein